MATVCIYLTVFIMVVLAAWTILPGLVERIRRNRRHTDGAGDPSHVQVPADQGNACWLCAGAGSVITVAVLGVLGPAPLPVLVLAGGIVGIGCFHIPRLRARRHLLRRRRDFEGSLLDVIVALTSCMRAGSALSQALEIVVRDFRGPVHEEFSTVLSEYRLGMPLPEALDRLHGRIPIEDLQLFAAAVRLSMQTGGSLADVLERISQTIRCRVEFQDNLQTLTAQGRFEAIAIAAMPLLAFLVLYVIDPVLMTPLLVTPMGWLAMVAVGVLEVIGFLCIRVLIKVEV